MSFKKSFKGAGLMLAGLMFAGSVLAQSVQVEHAWARATVPGQQSSGAFMVLTADADSALVGASSPVAGVTEVHEMKMEGDVMKMRAIEELPLPAGKAVPLESRGHHIMLMDLKQPLDAGSDIDLTLQVRGADGNISDVALQVPVYPLHSGSWDGHHEDQHGGASDHQH